MAKVLRRLRLDEISLVDAPANPLARVMLAKREDPAKKAEWDAAYIDDLPDSSFAAIEPGGQKDDAGKTTPRSLRHLPFKDKDGKVDLPHLRNALSRLPQTQLPGELKAHAQAQLEAAAHAAGVGDGQQKKEKSVSDKKKTAAAADIADLEKMLEELKKSSEGGDGDETTPEAKTLRRMVQKLIEDRKTAVFTKKAEALKGLPGTTVAKLAPLMKDIAEKAPEAWEQLEPLLKNWVEAFETSELFSEKGASGAEGATAEERATKLAQERINKGEVKDLAAALGLVFKADPALYREYRKESQFKVGVGSR